MVKKLFFLLFLSTASLMVFAQTTNQPPKVSEKDKKKDERKDRMNKLMKQYEEGSLIYSKQSAFGFKLNTDGWGLMYEHGKYKSISKTNLWWIEMGERHSPKEEKITAGQDLGGIFLIGNPYSYGKINNFYYLKGGIGQQILIGGKSNKNGVAVTGIYGGGITIGYLKPYYLSVTDKETSEISDIKYSDSTAEQFLDPYYINGSSGMFEGFFEGKIVPGAYARLALRFDYGRYNELLSALEVGIHVDYYSKEMPIMANNPAKKFFFNSYVAIEFGRRK